MEKPPRERSAVHSLLCHQGWVFSLVLAIPQGKNQGEQQAQGGECERFPTGSSLCCLAQEGAGEHGELIPLQRDLSWACPAPPGVSPAPGAGTGFRDQHIHVDTAAKEPGISCSSKFPRRLHLAASAEPHIPFSLQGTGKKMKEGVNWPDWTSLKKFQRREKESAEAAPFCGFEL